MDGGLIDQAGIDALRRDGWLRLPNAVDASAVSAMRDALWRELAERGMAEDRPDAWPAGGVGGFQRLSRSRAFDLLRSPHIDAACDALLGARRWNAPPHGVMPLVTFPQPGPWHLPRIAWHLDFAPRLAAGKLPGLRQFAFLAPVESHGGGTVLIEGSHRLVERLVEQGGAGRHSADLRRRLQRAHPWFAAFWSEHTTAEQRTSQLGRAAVIDGVEVRPLELTGSPGDVVVMHPWLLHAASPNCTTRPRLMLSQSVAVFDDGRRTTDDGRR